MSQRRTSRLRTRAAAIALCGTAFIAPACSDDDGPATDGGDGTTAATAATVTTVEPTAPPTTLAPPGEAVSVPEVVGPIEGGDRNGIPANPTPPALLAEYDYVEEEFFISGTATAYGADGELGQDGMWNVTPISTAPYTTRILVRRPSNPADANGAVAVEWFNTTGGQDADPDFGFLYPTLMPSGTTWVGVSAQFGGVAGPGFSIPIEGFDPKPLKTADPTRYAALEHPGDDYSYDIFSQAAQAVRRPNGADPLGGIQVAQVIAMGESQSAGRLTVYINAVHPIAAIYDGFLVHSRIIPASLSEGAAMPSIVNFRTDLDQPILWFQTETDVAQGAAWRQPNTDGLVTWEVAGTADADEAQLVWGEASFHVIDPSVPAPDFESMCGGALNHGPQRHVIRRVVVDLLAWVVDGTPPATAALMELNADGTLARDEMGIVIGGIRTPDVDVPIEVSTGNPRPDTSIICSLFGSSTPLDVATLAELYPTHDDYVAKVRAAAQAAEQAGFLLPESVAEIIAAAEATPIPE